MLREARNDDVASIRRWRNHPQVRAMSFTTHEIGEDEHASWWSKVQADPRRLLYVYERSGRPAGLVTIDLEPAGAATWGFYLDVDGLEATGELLPAWLEIEGEILALAFDDLGLRRLHGEMLADNSAVRQLHRRYGFTETDVATRTVDGAEREVVHIELLVENRRQRS